MASQEVIVLVRKFIKPARVEDYVAWFHQQPAVTADGFIAKWLTRVTDATALPPALSGFHVGGNPGVVTMMMVERWASIEAFKAYVPKAGTSDTDEFEALPRQRVILDVM